MNTFDLGFGEAILTRFGDYWRLQWMPHGNCAIGTRRFTSSSEARFFCAEGRLRIVATKL